MKPVSAVKIRPAGAGVVSLVSYLEADNERLRQAVIDLMLETSALRQEVEKMAGHTPE